MQLYISWLYIEPWNVLRREGRGSRPTLVTIRTADLECRPNVSVRRTARAGARGGPSQARLLKETRNL